LNPDDVLVEIPFDINGTACSHEEIAKQIQKHKEELALIFLSGVQYYNGQLFDMQGIAKAAKEAGAMVGFDLAHAVGNVAMKLHEWNIDFACWCSYKYLNGGPGTYWRRIRSRKTSSQPPQQIGRLVGCQRKRTFFNEGRFYFILQRNFLAIEHTSTVAVCLPECFLGNFYGSRNGISWLPSNRR